MIAINQASGFIYVDVTQNTEVWEKSEITKLPDWQEFLPHKVKKSLLNLGSWDIVRNGIPEEDMLRMTNMKCGHFYDDHALQYFMTKSKARVEKKGFFMHPFLARRTYY